MNDQTTAPRPTTRRVFDVDKDFGPILRGEVMLPNPEPLDPVLFLSNLASVGHGYDFKWGHSRAADGHKPWTAYFLTAGHNMSGTWYGEGIAVVYQSAYGGKLDGRVFRWAICTHEFAAEAGGNPRRGWNPGHCKLCGVDMSIDSGD